MSKHEEYLTNKLIKIPFSFCGMSELCDTRMIYCSALQKSHDEIIKEAAVVYKTHFQAI